MKASQTRPAAASHLHRSYRPHPGARVMSELDRGHAFPDEIRQAVYGYGPSNLTDQQMIELADHLVEMAIEWLRERNIRSHLQDQGGEG